MWIGIAALNLALAVMLGAFGAHGLQKIANAQQITWWHSATEYFFYHALGLLLLGIMAKVLPMPFLLIQIGIVLFCSSLYIMSLGMPRILGAITPIGGFFMILGWLALAWQAFKQH